MGRRAVRSFQVGIFMLAAGLAQAGAAGAAELISEPVRICESAAGLSLGSPGSLSADGRYTAFSSYAPNLVAGQQTDGIENVFLRDRISGTTVLVSHKAGDPLTGGSWTSTGPIVSADGNFVVFSSQAEDLVAGQAGAGTGFDCSSGSGPPAPSP